MSLNPHSTCCTDAVEQEQGQVTGVGSGSQFWTGSWSWKSQRQSETNHWALETWRLSGDCAVESSIRGGNFCGSLRFLHFPHSSECLARAGTTAGGNHNASFQVSIYPEIQISLNIFLLVNVSDSKFRTSRYHQLNSLQQLTSLHVNILLPQTQFKALLQDNFWHNSWSWKNTNKESINWKSYSSFTRDKPAH